MTDDPFANLSNLRSPRRAYGVLSEVVPLLMLAIPVVAGLLGETLLSATDALMLGPLGKVPLAAVSLTQSVLLIFSAALYGLVSAAGLRIANAHGAGDERRIASNLKHGAVLGLASGTAAAAIMALLLFVLPYAGQPAEVVAGITGYWLAMSAVLVPFTLILVIKQFLDSIGRAWTGAVLSLIPVAFNIPLNWLLIYGNLGAPRLGLFGSGIASLGAFLLALAVAVLYIRRAQALRPFRSVVGFHQEGLESVAREGCPMMVQYLTEGGAVAVAGVLVGLLGTVALAANQIVYSLASVVYMVPLGVSGAVAIRIAQASGAGTLYRLRAIGLAGLAVMLIWTLPFTLIMTMLGGSIARAFVDDADVIAAATMMFIAVGFMQVFDGLQSVSLGALRGLGDNLWPMFVSLVAYWLVALPLSVLLGFNLGHGGAGLWAGFGIGLAVAGLLLLARFLLLTRR